MDDTKQPNRIVLVLLAAAFLLGVARGGYLLGWPAGIMLGVFLAVSAFLLTDAFRSSAKLKPLRIIAASCFFCFVFAFVVAPTLISQDIQIPLTAFQMNEKCDQN